MNLIIDQGNTRIKCAVYENGLPTCFQVFETPARLISSLSGRRFDRGIISGTRQSDPSLERNIKNISREFLSFGPDVPVPLKNNYTTPGSLGSDRLAAAVGASVLYPAQNLLVVDLGTAITIDVVTADGCFAGGNITPGMGMRFQALHKGTASLPLLGPDNAAGQVLSTSTAEAIMNGVINGIQYELEGYITRLQDHYDGLLIIFTGGDGNFFAKRLKNTIFATYDLVTHGLNRILEYNVELQKEL